MRTGGGATATTCAEPSLVKGVRPDITAYCHRSGSACSPADPDLPPEPPSPVRRRVKMRAGSSPASKVVPSATCDGVPGIGSQSTHREHSIAVFQGPQSLCRDTQGSLLLERYYPSDEIASGACASVPEREHGRRGLREIARVDVLEAAVGKCWKGPFSAFSCSSAGAPFASIPPPRSPSCGDCWRLATHRREGARYRRRR